MASSIQPARLSRRVAEIRPSATLSMVARVQELRAAGVPVLDLTAGEPDFRPPAAAEEAGRKAIEGGQGRYTAAAGMAPLRAAAAALARDEMGLDYQAANVVITPGAKIGINQALMALVEPGEEVLVPAPYWTSYPDMVALLGGIPVLSPCDAAGQPSIDALETARTPRTRALILNTPCNPTGVVYSEERLREVGHWALEHDIAIISDEIYAALCFDGAEHHSPLAVVPELQETSVWINGASKAYAMTGWRIGFVGASETVAKAIAKTQSQLASCPSSISQYAALAALEHGAEDRARMHAAFERRCRMVAEALDALPGVSCARPRGAFYALPSIQGHLGSTEPESGRRIESGADFASILLELDQVALIAGDAFGAPDNFRISFATSEDVISEALTRIAARVAKLER